jgi:hypothetical protein
MSAARIMRGADVFGGLSGGRVVADGRHRVARPQPCPEPAERMAGGRGVPDPIGSAAGGIPGWSFDKDFAG